jgi:ligand-binding sensor domain-containing protein
VKRQILLLIVALLLPSALSAKWEILTNKNTVRHMLADPGGNRMHLATNGGLVGITFAPDTLVTYIMTIDGLSSNDLTCLARDASGNLLLGTVDRGIAIIFGDGTVRNYTTFDGLPDDRVLCVAPAGDEFWVGTAAGSVKMELDGTFVNRNSPIYFGEPLNYEVREIWPGETQVWFATSDGLWVLDGDELRSYRTAEGLADDSVRDIVPAQGDSLFIAGDSGVQVLAPSAGRFHDFSNGLVTESSKNVRELAQIGDDLWAATQGGAYRTGLDAAAWIDESLDLPTRDLLSITSGPSGSATAGTSGKGVAMRQEGGWSVRDFPGPPVNSLDKVAVSREGVVWASSWTAPISWPEAGIFRYDGLTYQTYTSTNSDLLLNLASSLAIAPDGRVWIGSPWHQNGLDVGGLSILDDGGSADMADDVWMTFKGTDTGLSGEAMRNCIAFKGNGEAWLGAWDNEADLGLPGGLDLLTYGDGEYVFRSFRDLVQGRDLQALAVDGNGDLWIGYTTTSVDVFVLRPVTTDGDSLFFPIDADLVYLAGESVLDLEIDPLGHLWVCTGSGVTELDYRNDPLDPSNFTWRNYTMDTSPLPDLQVNAVAFHGTRYVWFATPSGAVSYDRERGIWRTYDMDTSPLPHENVRDVAVDAGSGAVWFATKGGLAKLSMIEDEPPVAESGSIIVAPNPFFPARSPQGVVLGRFEPGTTVRVYNVSGSLIARLTAREETIAWDGRSEEGNEVPSGVYILVSESPGGAIGRGKIAIVR